MNGNTMLATKSLKIGSMTLKNRIVMPPIIAAYNGTEDGKVTGAVLDYYGARAASGNLGMIITEHLYITKQGKSDKHQLSIATDEDIPGLKRLAEVIRQKGTKAIAQINHSGSACPSKVTGGEPVAPSSIVLPVSPMLGDGEMPRALLTEEIAVIVEQFAEAAVRAKAAGFDGVEIHSVHGSLLNQFYSPLTNKREDAYGGSLDNRLRIHIEVLRAVRDAVGAEFPVSLRLGGSDYRDGGSTLKDCVYAARKLAPSGLNMLNLSGGMCLFMRPGHNEPGYFRDMSQAVRQAVSIPVMLTGGVKTLQDAEDLLQEGMADLIGVGRELLKNPHWEEDRLGVF